MTPTDEPVFAAPWHGQLFAMTLQLHEQGAFDWPQWTLAFGETLARHGLDRSLNGGDDYFQAWLETLEGLLDQRALSTEEERADVRAAWEQAYLATPHGQPVRLQKGRRRTPAPY